MPNTALDKTESAIIWSDKKGFRLALAKRPDDSVIPDGEIILTAIFIRLAKDEFCQEQIRWLHKRKAEREREHGPS